MSFTPHTRLTRVVPLIVCCLSLVGRLFKIKKEIGKLTAKIRRQMEMNNWNSSLQQIKMKWCLLQKWLMVRTPTQTSLPALHIPPMSPTCTAWQRNPDGLLPSTRPAPNTAELSGLLLSHSTGCVCAISALLPPLPLPAVIHPSLWSLLLRSSVLTWEHKRKQAPCSTSAQGCQFQTDFSEQDHPFTSPKEQFHPYAQKEWTLCSSEAAVAQLNSFMCHTNLFSFSNGTQGKDVLHCNTGAILPGAESSEG